jgi:UDP-N-acetylmuramyl tripeptide synthase
MKIVAIFAGKITYALLRMLGRMAGTLPGLVAEKIDPNILNDTLSKLPKGVVVITGTNGKTTTTKILTEMLSKKYRVLTNPTGSNFTRGIAAAVVAKCSISGKLNYDIAVIELDEAYAVKFVEKIKPDYSIILNVTRDQMDRFGEIDYTARLLEKVVKKTKKAVILNADDNRVRPMKEVAKCQVYYFGVADALSSIFVNDENLHTAQKQTRNIGVDAELVSLKNNLTTFSIDNIKLSAKLNFFGLYNSQNAVAASLLASKLGLNNTEITEALSTTRPAFGRGELFSVGSNSVVLQLVKNPAGFRQALIGASSVNSDITCLVINDNYADGRDVSWLWDVEFNKYIKSRKVVTSGHRAYDMSVRLAYDDIRTSSTIPDLGDFVDFVNSQHNKKVIIFTTYTAMLKLRLMFSKLTNLEEL